MKGRSTDSTSPAGGWLSAARAAWLALVAVNLVWHLVNLPAQYQQLSSVCETLECGDLLLPILSEQEAATLEELGFSLEFYAAFVVGTASAVAAAMLALGVIIFLRRSGDGIGLLTSFALISFGVGGAWPLAERSAGLAALAWSIDTFTFGSIMLVFFLFPDGRTVPRWTRYPVALILLFMFAILLPLAWLPEVRRDLDTGVGDLVIIGFLAAGLFAQVQRYRFHADAVQRQQTKWVLFGLASTLLSYLIWVLTAVTFPLQSGVARVYWNLFGMTALALLFTGLPISLAVSILRYRLFDIDLIINRTLVYGALTGTLALIYYLSVLLLQAIFPAESQLAIVFSTLTIAALFSPLRRRIQNDIDRRFYRRRYDAERAVTALSAIVRNQVDLEAMSTALLAIIDETLQPAQLSLWMSVTAPRTRDRAAVPDESRRV